MKEQFVLLNQKRIRLSSVKKYDPIESAMKDHGIKVYYSLSSRPAYDTFYFKNKKERDDAMRRIDDAFGLA